MEVLHKYNGSREEIRNFECASLGSVVVGREREEYGKLVGTKGRETGIVQYIDGRREERNQLEIVSDEEIKEYIQIQEELLKKEKEFFSSFLDNSFQKKSKEV